MAWYEWLLVISIVAGIFAWKSSIEDRIKRLEDANDLQEYDEGDDEFE